MLRERGRLLESLRPCFARTQVWVQARKYVTAVMSDIPERNGWSVARFCGDATPDKTQRLLNHASWDTAGAVSAVRRYVVAGLDEAARRNRRAGGLRVGALDESGQEKAGTATAGVKRQYMGCAGRVANGINTVYLSYVREGTGHALAGAVQWIPREQVTDPVTSLVTGLPLELAFRSKGQLAAGLVADALADGAAFDFIAGDEVYGASPDLREYLESRGQAYVLRVASSFPVTLGAGARVTCAQAVKTLLKGKRGWEVRSAGQGSKGQRWYAWAWIGTGSAGHSLLVRRHLKTGELAFHYCYVPEGQPGGKARLIRAAGLRWPAEEGFEFGKDQFGLDQCQARLYTAIARHTVLVMAALAVCAVAAALLRPRAGSPVPPPAPGQQAPGDCGLIPLTVPEIRRITAALTARPLPPGHIIRWDTWTRRHQARARWYHQLAHFQRDYTLVS